MNTVIGYVFGIEGALLVLAILIFAIYEISTRHPQAFQLPKVTLPKFSLPDPKQGSWLDKLKQDFSLIYKPLEPEFFTSPDGNTLYLSLKYTADWKPAQVILFMLSQKQEFLDQLKAKDPTVLQALDELESKLTTSNVAITFKRMNILPTFTKNMIVWKLPLSEPPTQLAEDIIVKELGFAK